MDRLKPGMEATRFTVSKPHAKTESPPDPLENGEIVVYNIYTMRDRMADPIIREKNPLGKKYGSTVDAEIRKQQQASQTSRPPEFSLPFTQEAQVDTSDAETITRILADLGKAPAPGIDVKEDIAAAKVSGKLDVRSKLTSLPGGKDTYTPTKLPTSLPAVKRVAGGEE